MKEIEVSELKRIYKKVPQIKHVPIMKKDYGIWSQVAHNIDSLDLLGYNFDDETHKRFYVHPTYTENTISTLCMSIGLFEMFAIEIIILMGEMMVDYKSVEEGKFLLSFNEFVRETNIPFF